MSLTPDTRLGPYEVTAQIGAGGMGEVYKARDTRLERTVAIKVLPAALAADPQFRERFDREARAISTCGGDGTLMGVGAPDVARTRRGEYICEYIMPTTVHIPVALLEAVDRRARALKLSRNRLVVRALEREVMEPSGWSPEFLDRLRNVDVATAEAVDELMATVRAGRRSKRPREL